jgi:putative nucleotidyltransferase with HDIG domain
MNAMSSKFTSELKEGMVTLSDTYSTKGKLVIPKDTVITSTIINRLVDNDVLFVDIDDGSKGIKEEVSHLKEEVAANMDAMEKAAADGSQTSGDKADSENQAPSFEIDTESIEKTPEYKKFRRRYVNTMTDMSKHLNDIVTKNAPINVDQMLGDTLNILRSSDSKLSMFTMMSTLKSYDDSTFNHSLNVALICNILGGWLGLPESDCELLTSCGLFHDIGKLLIPDKIIKKPGKLTDEEYEIVKTHPRKGYDLLTRQNVDIHIQYAALMHHEKCDGSGYPLGLIDNQIDWCAQIVTIADIYEAMTAKRVYRDPLSPFTVIENFERDGLKKYNPKFLLTFLENVVNSYMNCRVRLSNGEQGDIVYINRVSLSKPLIKTKDDFIDLSKKSDINIESIL